MKTEAQGNPDARKLGDLIEDVKVAMLATRAADGSIVSRPLQTLEYDGSGDLVFFTGADSHKLDELGDQPEINLTYANPSKQVYVSVRGRASVDRDRATIDKLWSAAMNVYFAKGKDDPNLVVLRVTIRDAAYWDASGNFVGQAINFAKASMSRDPSKLGEHGKLSP